MSKSQSQTQAEIHNRRLAETNARLSQQLAQLREQADKVPQLKKLVDAQKAVQQSQNQRLKTYEQLVAELKAQNARDKTELERVLQHEQLLEAQLLDARRRMEQLEQERDDEVLAIRQAYEEVSRGFEVEAESREREIKFLTQKLERFITLHQEEIQRKDDHIQKLQIDAQHAITDWGKRMEKMEQAAKEEDERVKREWTTKLRKIQDEFRASCDRYTEELERERERADTCRRENEELRNLLVTCKGDAASCQTKQRSCAQELEKCTENADERERNIQECAALLHEANVAAQPLVHRVTELEETLRKKQELIDKYESDKEKRKDVTEAHLQCLIKQKEYIGQLHDLGGRILTLETENTRLTKVESAAERLKHDYEALQKQCAEERNRTVESASERQMMQRRIEDTLGLLREQEERHGREFARLQSQHQKHLKHVRDAAEEESSVIASLQTTLGEIVQLTKP